MASGLELRVPDRCWSMLERLRLELPGGAGGAEVDVAFLSVLRRAPEAKTYAGEPGVPSRLA